MGGLRPESERPGPLTGSPRRIGAALGGAALGGASVGLLDVAFVVRADSLQSSAAQGLALAALQAVALGVGVALLALPLLLLSRGRTLGRAFAPLLGLALGLGLELGERTLRDPPPFTEPPLLNAHPALLLVALGLGAVGVVLGARLSRVPRLGRLAMPLGLGVAALVLARPARELPPAGSAGAAKVPLVLVTLDTTRDDHVGRSNRRARTPTLEGLARAGARFELAMSQIPITGPSHTTILSGQGPWSHGVMLNGHPVPADLPLLAELLRAQGYRTGAFVSAYVLEGSFGFARGFEVYDDDFGAMPGWSDTLAGRIQAGISRNLSPELAVERRADTTVDRAMGWLERAGLEDAEQPFFLWVHLFDPHGPYEAPPPWDQAYYEGDPRDPSHQSMRRVKGVAPYLLPSLEGITDLRWPLAQYAGEVSFADQELARLLDWVEAHHPDALVAVAGDHGESLGEHGVWFNHGDDLFDPSMRVPLLLRMKDRVPAGVRVETPVELVDLTPTLLDLLGLPASPAAEGRALSDWISGAPPSAPPHLFARSLTYDRPANMAARVRGEIESPRYRMVALRTVEGRYVLREAPGEGELWYDLVAAPDESVTASMPGELALALRASAEALLEGEARPSADALDAATAERLRALGYVDE